MDRIVEGLRKHNINIVYNLFRYKISKITGIEK